MGIDARRIPKRSAMENVNTIRSLGFIGPRQELY